MKLLSLWGKKGGSRLLFLSPSLLFTDLEWRLDFLTLPLWPDILPRNGPLGDIAGSLLSELSELPSLPVPAERFFFFFIMS